MSHAAWHAPNFVMFSPLPGQVIRGTALLPIDSCDLPHPCRSSRSLPTGLDEPVRSVRAARAGRRRDRCVRSGPRVQADPLHWLLQVTHPAPNVRNRSNAIPALTGYNGMKTYSHRQGRAKPPRQLETASSSTSPARDNWATRPSFLSSTTSLTLTSSPASRSASL